MFTQLSVTVADGIARLTFDDPQRGNPIDGVLCSELCEAAVVISEDPDVRAVLVTANGKAFSYGGDIHSFAGDLDSLPLNIKRWTTTLHSAIARFQRMDAPVVAAVHNVCAGGMAAFVAGADIVVAADDARFISAYSSIGYSNDAGASIMWSRRMGPARARRFIMLGETLDAKTALEAGLVDEVQPVTSYRDRAEEIARQFASGPTRAYGEIRRLFLSVNDQPLEAQLELEAQALARIAATSDAREGLTAFSERRKPVFQGR
jgi:2-(1,2-epoxy-1,2-dihydrophenyl)acetyl-CoA isomerase